MTVKGVELGKKQLWPLAFLILAGGCIPAPNGGDENFLLTLSRNEQSPGTIILEIINNTDEAVCTTNAGLGQLTVGHPFDVRVRKDDFFQNIYDVPAPPIEEYVVLANTAKTFEVDFSVHYSASHREKREVEVSALVPVFPCDSPDLWHAIAELERNFGPGYLTDQGVVFVESDAIRFLY